MPIRSFARVAGSTFGGLEVRPSLILAQVWSRIFGDLSEGGADVPRFPERSIRQADQIDR